ncbi:RNA-guided endonuclease TnpB family protein [Okeania sp. KiyG1]|uniref:RNA-guided endonuclease TnpB family protein n=1 Tax=Okeania sp. KiyG1 TaxID=2720165 RepID=UPI0035C8E162
MIILISAPTQLIRENQTVVVEEIAVKNMVKKRCDPATTLVARERAPRDHKLARAINDANWGELVRQLEYKAEWYGRELIKIDRYFPSSKRCSNCGHVVEKLPLKIREWDCPECAAHHDRDINASINILRMGTRVGVRRKGTPTLEGCGRSSVSLWSALLDPRRVNLRLRSIP